MTYTEMKDHYKRCTEESHGMCFICHRPAVQIHHIFGGANRDKSTEYDLMVHLCADCHDNAHRRSDVRKMLHEYGIKKFKEEHPDLSFHAIFGRYE